MLAITCTAGLAACSEPANDDACQGAACGGVGAPAGTTGGLAAGQGGVGGVLVGAGGVSGATAGAGGAPPPAGTGGAGGAGGAAGMIAGAGGAAGMIAGAGGLGAGSGGSGGAGSGGAAGDAAPPAMSSGCGAADWPASGTFTIDVDGLQREYIVKIPDGYDTNHPHRLIFTWHYLGGSAAGIAGGFGGGYYGLESRAGGSAIFVSPEGIDAAWPNTGGRDVAFARAMVEWMRSSYCVDNARIFSTGFSYGAIMSNTVGCQMGDVFRAIAPMSGSGPLSFGATSCKGPVAAWISHGDADNVVSFSGGEGSRDHWLTANGCEMTSAPTTPSPCVAYDGCDAGFPVVWCVVSGGGHTQPSFGPDAIWAFFEQF